MLCGVCMMPRESKASQERLCLCRCCDNSCIIIIIGIIINIIIINIIIILDVTNAWMIGSFVYTGIFEVCLAPYDMGGVYIYI